MYRSLLNFFFKNAALKTIVIPLSTICTRISAAALIKFPKCGAYLSNYCNLQVKGLLQLGKNVITFRTLLHLGSFITFRPSSYGHVITKFSRLGRLLHFLTHGALLACFARESSANNDDDDDKSIVRLL